MILMTKTILFDSPQQNFCLISILLSSSFWKKKKIQKEQMLKGFFSSDKEHSMISVVVPKLPSAESQ